jgi:multiple sugar transport system permease protein
MNFQSALAPQKAILKTISYIGLTICATLTLIPFIWMVLTALKPGNEVFTNPPTIIGSKLAWGNFAEAWNFFPFDRFFLNTVYVSAAITILELLTASLAAYAFARLRFPGRDKLFLLYLGTLMIPGQVTIVPQFILINYFGWIDTYQALILPNAFTAFGTFLLRQFFLTIPYELEEAARMDGCSRFGTFFRIILPLSKPALATLAVFSFVSQWNSFMWPLIITNTDEMKTLSVGLRMFQGVYSTEWHYMMAASSIAVVPTLILFAFLQRYLVEGITLSGLGGR